MLCGPLSTALIGMMRCDVKYYISKNHEGGNRNATSKRYQSSISLRASSFNCPMPRRANVRDGKHGEAQHESKQRNSPIRNRTQHTRKANNLDAGTCGGNTTHGNTSASCLRTFRDERSQTHQRNETVLYTLQRHRACMRRLMQSYRSFPRRGWDRSGASGWSSRACLVVDRGSWCSSQFWACWSLFLT